MTLDYAVNQVLVRIAEEDDASTIAELPDADGVAATPTITTRAQIITYLNEGQRKLFEAGVLQLRSKATETSIAVGTQTLAYSEITDATGRNPLRPVAATWTITGTGVVSNLVVIGREQFERHLPSTASRSKTGTPQRLYFAEDHLVLWPIPSAIGILYHEGLFHPKLIVDGVGATIADVPARFEDALIAFGCFCVARQRMDNAGLAERLPAWRTEWDMALGHGAKTTKTKAD